MTRRTLIHTALLVALIGAIGIAAAGRTAAAEPPTRVIQLVSSDAASRFVPLGIGKSIVIDLPRDIKDVLVSDPTIANAVIRSSRRAYIIGVKIGQSNVFFFDANGQQIGGLDIAVTRDLNGVRAALKRAFRDVYIEGVGDGVLLSGNVATPAESQRAFDIATRLVGSNETDHPKVVNDITIYGREQVMIKVTVAEVDREVLKQLGINLSGTLSRGPAVVHFNTPGSANQFPVNGPLSTPTGGFAGTFPSVTAQLQAMDRAGVVRTLAEPTLTAISGESANFLAGGKFPYPSVQSCSVPPCAPTIEFQNFGVSLSFTPVVLAGGRISLKVTTEASELDQLNSVSVSGTTVPGLKVRHADTTVELPSGGSIAMAGMIEEQTKHQITGLPGLMQVPILGVLFKSRDYLNSETELMVIATPYIVQAVAQDKLSRPDDGFADATDPGAVLLSRLNRVYGKAAPTRRERTYYGNIGFIID